MAILKHTFIYLLMVISLPVMASEEFEKAEIVKLSQEQILDGQIELLKASPVTLCQTFAVPAKISINEQGQALVVAKAPGIVTRINKNIGDPVLKDEVLAVFESKEMAEAKASYMTALKRNNLALQTLKTEEMLKDKKISSQQDYLKTVLAAEEAAINLEVALQQLYLLGIDEDEIKLLNQSDLKGLCCYSIRAPIHGVVISKNVTLGALVGADQEVYKIANLDNVWVELGLYANHLARIKPGHKILISPIKENLPQAEATITQISPLIDEHNRTATAFALLPNKTGIWYPGAYVRAKIIGEEIPVSVAVVKEAVQDIEGKTIVFVAHPEGFEKREVKLGQSDQKYIEILSGLDVHTPYAATHTFLIKAEDGKKDAEL